MADPVCPALTSAPVALLSFWEAAELLGVSVRTIRRWVKLGVLPAVTLSRITRRIAADDLTALIEASRRVAGRD